jgi:hypothetical protein
MGRMPLAPGPSPSAQPLGPGLSLVLRRWHAFTVGYMPRSWETWTDMFRERGYERSAPGWPGDPDSVAEARLNPESIADHGVDDVVTHTRG